MMLLLESLDPSQRSASFLAVSGPALKVREEFARMAEVAAGLGYRELLLHFATSSGGISQLEAYVGPERRSQRRGCLGRAEFPEMNGAPSAVATLPELELSGHLEENQPLYELSLQISPGSTALLDEALHLMLATWGEENDSLLELRTALFEIGSHFLDHAESLAARPGSESAHSIRFALRFTNDGIRGWMSDDGPPFDPSSEQSVHLKNEMIRSRVAAGESPGWFCHLLDEYEHVLEENGNRIGFYKKVVQ